MASDALARTQAPVLELSDGARAEIRDGALELRDREGRMLVRYRDGCAEVCAPAGDLTLSAPAGKVLVRSALDVEIDAQRDVVQRARRRISSEAGETELSLDPRRAIVRSREVVLDAETGRAALGKASVVAREIVTRAEALVHEVERYELLAGKALERTRESVREVRELLVTRAGRMRTLVDDAYNLWSRRTSLISKNETAIDGERIHLG